MKEKNELIARNCFASLVLDYDFAGDDVFPPCVVCRVLIDGDFATYIHADTVQDAISDFYAGTWRD